MGGRLREVAAISSSNGLADAGKIVATDEHGKLSDSLLPAPVSDSKMAFEDLPSSSFVAITSNGVVRANAAAGFPAVAFVRPATTAGEMAPLQTFGPLNGLYGLVRGQDYYLSSVLPGQITPTPPTAGLVQRLGTASATDVLLVQIDPPVSLI